MENNFLIYITENGNLRTSLLTFNIVENVVILKATPQEKYLVTGLVLGGHVIDSSSFPYDLILAGLKPEEIFMFRSSNKLFFTQSDIYRQENKPFELKIDPKKNHLIADWAYFYWGLSPE